MGKVFDRWSLIALVFTVVLSILRAVQWGFYKGLRITLVAALIYTVLSLPNYLRARRRVYQKDGPPYDVPRTFRFSESEIEVGMDGCRDSILSWETIQRVSQRRGFLFLIFAQDRHCPIPNDAFLTDVDRESFFKIVAQRGIPLTQD